MIPPFISRRSRKHWYNTTMRGYWHGPSLQEALINEEEEEGRGEKKELFIHSWYIYIYIRKHWRQTHCAPRYIRVYDIFQFFPGKMSKCRLHISVRTNFSPTFNDSLSINVAPKLFSLFFFFIYIYSSSNAI